MIRDESDASSRSADAYAWWWLLVEGGKPRERCSGCW
jgi:hypothetical protein